MTTATRLTLAAAALGAGVALASAQTPQEREAHHPGDQSATQVQQPAMPGAMMEGDMAQMMAMMMRGGMMPMGMGPAGMQAFQHIEGQIAFYKAELQITDAQAPQWNAFADALRSNATRMQQAMAPGAGTQGVVAAPEQMERRIAMLTAQLDAMQAVLATAKPLYAALSDEQQNIADELMAEHMMALRARGI